MYITNAQLDTLHDIAVELRRLCLIEEQIGSPAAYQLKQMDRVLPDLALRIDAMIATVRGQSRQETRQ